MRWQRQGSQIAAQWAAAAEEETNRDRAEQAQLQASLPGLKKAKEQLAEQKKAAEQREKSEKDRQACVGYSLDTSAAIPDPKAKRPAEWDEEMDGEWDIPQVPNPAHKPECHKLESADRAVGPTGSKSPPPAAANEQPAAPVDTANANERHAAPIETANANERHAAPIKSAPPPPPPKEDAKEYTDPEAERLRGAYSKAEKAHSEAEVASSSRRPDRAAAEARAAGQRIQNRLRPRWPVRRPAAAA